MGVLAHRLRMLDHSLVPPSTQAEIFRRNVCRVTFKHLPKPLQSNILSFGTLGQFFKIAPFSAQKTHSEGEGGVSQSIFFVEY